MRILITGGCGFIGSNLIRTLEALDGHQVRVFDNESLGKREHLHDFQGEFVKGDIRDPGALKTALAGVDAVVHLAADTRVIDSIENPGLNFEVNVQGSFNLLQAMRDQGVARLINASTGGAILGEVEPPVHEDMVANPVSPYGASKLAVEGYCSAFAGSYGFKAVSLRFSNVYGPLSFHKGSVVAAFYKQLLAGKPITVYGDGEQIRDFVFVEDLCDGILQAIARSQVGVFQLGSGRPVSVNALIEAMNAVVAPLKLDVRYEPARAGEIRSSWCEVSRARSTLGFRPDTSLHEGLSRTWAWFLDQRAQAA